MQTLEQRVRNSLIRKEADENYKLLSRPKYQGIIKDSMKIMINSIFEILMKDEELKGEDFSSEITPEIEKELDKMMSNPAQMKKVAYDAAENSYLKRKQLDAKFEGLYAMLNKTGDFGKEALQEFKKANETIYEAFEHQEKIVSELVKVAKKDGIRKALTNKAEYKVIKGIFPTADEYIAHSLNLMQLPKKYFPDFQKAMMMDGEVGKATGAVAAGLQEAIEKMPMMKEEFLKERIQEKAKKIYG